MQYCYVTELHVYDFVIKDFEIKRGHYLCQTIYMYMSVCMCVCVYKKSTSSPGDMFIDLRERENYINVRNIDRLPPTAP